MFLNFFLYDSKEIIYEPDTILFEIEYYEDNHHIIKDLKQKVINEKLIRFPTNIFDNYHLHLNHTNDILDQFRNFFPNYYTFSKRNLTTSPVPRSTVKVYTYNGVF